MTHLSVERQIIWLTLNAFFAVHIGTVATVFHIGSAIYGHSLAWKFSEPLFVYRSFGSPCLPCSFYSCHFAFLLNLFTSYYSHILIWRVLSWMMRNYLAFFPIYLNIGLAFGIASLDKTRLHILSLFSLFQIFLSSFPASCVSLICRFIKNLCRFSTLVKRFLIFPFRKQ